MLIGRIEGATRVLDKVQGYLGLPVREMTIDCPVNGATTPAMVTAWHPTPNELAALNAGACVHVRLLGRQHPPIMVGVGPAPKPVNAEDVPRGVRSHPDMGRLSAARPRLGSMPSRLGGTPGSEAERSRHRDQTQGWRGWYKTARRILALCPEWKQRNLTARAVTLAEKGRANWSPGELAEWQAGEALWDQVVAIRTASDMLETAVPIPDDYSDDSHWPAQA